MYWCDAETRTVEAVDLCGNGRAVIRNMSEWETHPFDLALYGSYLLWTDWNAATIMRMNLTNKMVTNEGPYILQKAAGMHVYAVPGMSFIIPFRSQKHAPLMKVPCNQIAKMFKHALK